MCDESSALLNAVVCTFTPYLTVEQYTQACSTKESMPASFIRIDVAHFIKSWAVFLSKLVRPRIKEFYMCAIGTLIICKQLLTAKAIIKSLFIISSSETFGQGTPSLNDGEQLIKSLATEESPDAVQMKHLIAKICELHNPEVDTLMEDGTTPNDSWNTKNVWREWGLSIKNEALSIIAQEEGEFDNPRYCPQICSHLLKKVETIVLWGNVCRNDFGFGRVPASSASVEAEFNLIKTHILQHKIERVDVLVETLISQDK